MKFFWGFFFLLVAVIVALFLSPVHYGVVLKSLTRFIDSYRLPPFSGTLDVEGLYSPVEIVRDENGVSHVYAKNVHDMIFAQGFVHAQERLWQMELFRRVAKGTISEIFGESTVDLDKITRSLGIRRLGAEDTEYLKERKHTSLAYDSVTTYTEGVNSYLKSDRFHLPLELWLLGAKVDPWTEVDTLTHHRLFNWQMCRGWVREILRLNFIHAVGESYANELEPVHPSSALSLALAEGVELGPFKEFPNTSTPLDGTNNNWWFGIGPENGGSNAYAVHGRFTEGGKSFLASDPHLALVNPGIWIPIHLHSPGLNWLGFSVPGLPWIFIGHNDHFSFGITLSHADVEDVFIEQVKENKYLYKDEWLPLVNYTETIRVKGKPDVEVLTQHTHHGPLLSQDYGALFSEVPLSFTDRHSAKESVSFRYSLQSTAIQTNSTPAICLVNLMLSNNANEALNSLKPLRMPPANFILADRENIAYYLAGDVPIRPKSDGTLPVPGWTGEHEWKGYVPADEKPMSINPESGYVYSANNKPVSDDFKYFLGKTWAPSYRGQRLQQILRESVANYSDTNKKMPFQHFIDLQLDKKSLVSEEYRDFVQSLFPSQKDLSPNVQKLLQILKEWNGLVTSDSVAASVYQVSKLKTFRRLIQGRLGDLTDYVLGKGFNRILKAGNENNGYEASILLSLLRNSTSLWLKNVSVRDLVRDALEDTHQFLSLELGEDTSQWRWGKIHKATFRHLFTAHPLLAHIFDVGPVEIGGDGDTVAMSSMLLFNTYDARGWSVSGRMLVDHSNPWENSRWVTFPGVSGNLGSPYYANWKDAFWTGETFSTLANKQALKDAEKITLVGSTAKTPLRTNNAKSEPEF